MDYKCSIDNLTICGQPSEYVFNNLENNNFIKNHWTTPNQQYHYHFICEDGAYIQVKHKSDWNKDTRRDCKLCKGIGRICRICEANVYDCECKGGKRLTKENSDYCIKCEGSGVRIFTNENAIRIEFNPNQYNAGIKEEYMMDILKNVWNPHITRRDIAFDFFELDLSDFKIFDLNNRSKITYSGRQDELQTLYLGAQKSDVRIRIYNKALEQKLDGVIWWRVEAQLRKNYADTLLFNPFDVIRIKRNFDFKKYSFKDRAMCRNLIYYPDEVKDLARNSRLKYQKMLHDEIESEELKLNVMFREQAVALQQDVESWISISHHSNRQYKGTHKPKTILTSNIKSVKEIMTLHDALELEKVGGFI